MPEKKKTIYDILAEVQSKLNVPKNKFNSFGGYKYRSLEDIFEAVKKLQQELNFNLIVADDMVIVNDRIYVKATATFMYNGENIIVSAFAREPEIKKGMDVAQVTGASSSYARKYALSGLFLLDDNQNPDETNTEPQNKVKKDIPKKEVKQKSEKWDNKQFLELTSKLIKERNISDNALKIVLEMHGFKTLKEINDKTKATEIYKAIKTMKVEDVKWVTK